jgi:hypothetical protein
MSPPDEGSGGARTGADRSSRPEAEGPPPFLGSWGRLYAAVLGWLVLLIVLFYIFTESFS